MSFNIKKGGSFSFKKSLNTILIGCGWDVSVRSGENYDIDSHALALIGGELYSVGGEYPLALSYANGSLPKAPEIGAKAFRTANSEMIHRGDNRTGAGEGDDEQIEVQLGMIPPQVTEIALWATIYESDTRRQSFDKIGNAYIRVMDKDNNIELCRYSLNEKFMNATAVQVAALMRQPDGGWQFVAIGNGAKADLGDILAQYGAG